MFSTIDSDRIALPVGLQEPNQSVWSHVELLLSVPWLFVEISAEEDNQKIRQIHFLLYWEQFADLASRPEISIERVILATPGHMNRTSQWRFEELSEAWICTAPSNPAQAMRVYVVSSGAVYNESFLETPPIDLTRITKVFPADVGQESVPSNT
jgi:hypothetical protein